jgi:integrative and conjugative element protein (TIGR02256 family)
MIEVPGETIEENEIQIPKARELTGYLLSGVHPAASLLRASRDPESGAETVEFEVRVELAQNRKFPIQPIETIAASFAPEDDVQPEVVSLREDFPIVPHLNLRPEELPRSLCLYDISYDAIKLRWTAATFIERVREWLSLTAEGRLHQDDQPQEPLILGPFSTLILPATFHEDSFEEPDKRKRYAVIALAPVDGTPTAFRLEREGSVHPQHLSHVVLAFAAVADGHGAIRHTPTNLSELILLCEASGLDLRARLKEEVPHLRDDPKSRQLRVLLVTAFSKQREGGGSPSWETLGFELGCDVENLGERLGLWAVSPLGSLGALIGPQEETTQQVPVSTVRPVLELTKATAARYNGIQCCDEPLVLIGVGALGSMLLSQLARKGFGRWTALDGETMLPHNAARHLLPGNAAGFPKAETVQNVINTYYREGAVVKSLAGSSLHPGALKVEIDDAILKAAAIIDCSADVPSARGLCLDIVGTGRRISVFLSPNGESMVILAEDRNRAVMLDSLEMQYYRMLLNTPDLSDHFLGTTARIRYGRSCRDLSAVLSGDAIAMFAAIGSRFIPQQLDREEGCIRVWKANQEGSVRTYSCPVASSIRTAVGGETTIVWDAETVRKLRELRAQRLPSETGGEILGNWDQSRRILYIVDVLGAPTDSEENPTGFVRGTEGLRETLESADRLTGGSAQYVGEWHSHPDGCSTRPSHLDQNLFRSMTERLFPHGLTPIMLIVGERDLRWIAGPKMEEAPWNFPS